MIPSDDILSQYKALTEACGYHRFSQRTILELTGADRTKFLHNFCTADMNRLQAGEGSEAFITNVQGKTIGYLYVLVASDRIVLENAAGQSAALLPHLGKYILLDDAELEDHSDRWASVLVAGPQAAELLKQVCGCEVPQSIYGNAEFEAEGSTIMLAQVNLAGAQSYLLLGDATAIEKLCQQLAAAGAISCEAESVNICRLEAGAPQYGSEVTDANLPQELSRDAQAISFTKGCYLGQETVARIDALGHVNRYLRCVKFTGDTVPDLGWEHRQEGKTVLKVTSAGYSPQLESPLALAFVRRGHEKVGNQLDTELGEAVIIEPLAW